MRAIGYIRVSTDEQAKEGNSLGDQERDIRQYATEHSWELERIYADEGKSAKTLERDGLCGLLDRVDAGGIGAVIVTKLDRLTRETSDALGLDAHFRSKGVDLCFIYDEADTSTPDGELIFTIRAALSKYERRIIAARTKLTLAHKKQRGEWIGRVPYGYRMNERGGILVEDDDAQGHIKRAKELKRRGYSYRRIAEHLGVALGTAHKLINTHSRSMKARYCNSLATSGVH
jgi:DNA invertase Pin-like site-specific DNA recombinase